MRRRILVLPLSAAIIAGLVAYKLNQPPQQFASTRELAAGEFPAPLFQLYDQSSKMYRLARDVGRHKLVVVFFDSSFGADRNPRLQMLRSEYERLTAGGVHLLAISPATPFANRESFKRGGKFPFPLLSDPDFQVHQAWGAFDEDARRPIPTVFLIDRTGTIRHTHVEAASTLDAAELRRELDQMR
jgi:peroxiredoxin Q/BCP